MPVIGTRAGSHTAPQQHKQPSRKGRKAWRKNVDVSEVERGLEERNEEIIKGGIVSEKQSDELFQVADEGDLAVAKTLAKKYTKGLKADEIIAARSVVPAVSGRKRAGDEPKSKTTDGVLPAKRQRTADYVSHKELLRLKSVANGHHTATVTVAEATYDPWAEEPTAVVLAAAKKTTATALKKKNTAAVAAAVAAATPDALSFLPPAVTPKPPRSLRQAPVSLAANGKPIPAVATPAGALSYNPAFNEYAARLEAEGAKAVEAERRRLAEAEAERVRMEAVARSAAEADAAEARAELSEWDEDESAWEGFESEVGEGAGGGGVSAALLAKRPKRKTPAQRNRANRRKAAEALERHQAKERRLKEQAERLEQLVSEAAAVAKRDAADNNNSEDDGDGDDEEATGDDSVLRRRQLGKFRLPEKDLELVLPDELQDSLRLLRPEGNLLRDRYRSVLVRGKVEARRKRPYRKQAKVKITEKWAHKDFQLF